MECFCCAEEVPDDENKCWLIEKASDDPSQIELNIAPNPVHRECAARLVGSRGPLGRTVVSFKMGQTQPSDGYGLTFKS